MRPDNDPRRCDNQKRCFQARKIASPRGCLSLWFVTVRDSQIVQTLCKFSPVYSLEGSCSCFLPAQGSLTDLHCSDNSISIVNFQSYRGASLSEVPSFQRCVDLIRGCIGPGVSLNASS